MSGIVCPHSLLYWNMQLTELSHERMGSCIYKTYQQCLVSAHTVDNICLEVITAPRITAWWSFPLTHMYMWHLMRPFQFPLICVDICGSDHNNNGQIQAYSAGKHLCPINNVIFLLQYAIPIILFQVLEYLLHTIYTT